MPAGAASRGRVADPSMPHSPRKYFALVGATVFVCWCAGILGRGYWTPDEPREADLAWRMSWQASKAVPLLAGVPFCEKPPLTYWVAGAAIGMLGADAWAARLPNLLYALLTALAVGSIGYRCAGPVAGWVAAAAIGTLLLSYQVAIWLATDAPLLAAVAVALWGLHVGFYADRTSERLRGYCVMHLALAVGFLCKSAAAWMVPALTLVTLVIWERRWRELLRWEFHAGLLIEAAIIIPWVWSVYEGADGPDHLKVFFWNNLVGRFTHVDAPEELQYAAAHRNSPGKYLVELPVYLWPWTVLAVAAARRAWQHRRTSTESRRALRFAVATFVPALAVLSVAATARNIYLAPALPGVALLLGGWAAGLSITYDRWDVRALRATSLLLLLAAATVALATAIVGLESWQFAGARTAFVTVSFLGVAGAGISSVFGWKAAARQRPLAALCGLLFAYAALLIGPASQIYHRVDAWQDLRSIGLAIARDAKGRPLVLVAPDETTRAFIDMYARTSVAFIPGPVTASSTDRLRAQLAADPTSVVVTQLPGRDISRTLRALAERVGLGARFSAGTDASRPAGPQPGAPQPAAPSTGGDLPAWAARANLHLIHGYALPNGRRYALLAWDAASASR
jgi:4-amino-4-deoxy-L-arabinose transferase-like glycosyltransferase